MNKQLKENVDYELIPGQREDSWDIRILNGEFVETVFYYDKITVVDDEGLLNFNFSIVTTPDPDLTVENEGLQKYAADVLYDIITESVKEAEGK